MSQLSGTNDTITAAIEKYSDMVRRICFLYLKNDADVEDVFQEVFLKFFQNFDTFESEEHQKAWLCRVAFNKCKDLHKSFWRKNVVGIEDRELPYELPEQSEVTKAVLELPPDQKELIYLHYYEGRPIPEIAEIMQKNQNTVYSLLRRAKTRLKKKVSELE
ncbi:MAG TPA: sigma-70 family RNA polymerase sigma factor [Oscillospiraceae bacterium]|nr:sigma-70 family RNA polymerase sigma factor [Oscillospiraceae bacterium]HPF55588.1 sigma-70 family RNA polymerase sigma factor [Clostridiales bacterium]HPK35823.1 sigma-70 family RNA polymerase sigma factor [Oscillospiraceae bacterium]HPR76341.1 sigma-70 family RNA polymerase sigma factor [Oscillospiraceae bacterium]